MTLQPPCQCQSLYLCVLIPFTHIWFIAICQMLIIGFNVLSAVEKITLRFPLNLSHSHHGGKKSFLLSIQIPPQFSLPVLLSGHPLASTALRKSNSNLSNLCLQLKRCKHGNMFCTPHQHNHFLLIIW